MPHGSTTDILYTDCQTTYERRWGRTYGHSITEFAETLLYRPIRHDIPKSETGFGLASAFRATSTTTALRRRRSDNTCQATTHEARRRATHSSFLSFSMFLFDTTLGEGGAASTKKASKASELRAVTHVDSVDAGRTTPATASCSKESSVAGTACDYAPGRIGACRRSRTHSTMDRCTMQRSATDHGGCHEEATTSAHDFPRR